MSRKWILLLMAIMGAIVFAACADNPPSQSNSQAAQQSAQQNAANNQIYIPKNHVELNNYNNRQKIADDPTTILWCTSAFPIPSSPLFTVPVVGKLTSANKRPYSTSIVNSYYENGGSYSPELPGPDGMYGASSDYRYGFTPAGVYVDFYNLDTFCTIEPTIWQRQNTKIVLGTDDKLFQAQQAARAALQAGDPKKAEAILEAAING